MFVNENFNFSVAHSIYSYKTKEQSKIALSLKRVRAYNNTKDNPDEHLSKMAFVRDFISITTFAEMATSGYTFCNLFSYDPNRKYYTTRNKWHSSIWPEYRNGMNKGGMKMQMKADEYYEGCQCFFVDIDYTEYQDIRDYIAALKFKPTVVYMSYSDNVCKIDKQQKDNPKYDAKRGIKSRRFRLCYVFNEIIYGKDDFQLLSGAILKMVEESTHEIVQDDCGKKMSQYFNGSTNKEVYVTGWIYEKADFSDYTPAAGNTESLIEGQKITNILDHPIVTSLEQSSRDRLQKINPCLIIDMERLSYDEFMLYNRHKYRYYYRKDDGTWENGYQVIDNNYFSLYFHTKKLRDGEKRRKNLFERMCIRRVMFPNITPDEVLFCAYEDLYRFIDNSDDTITIDCLVKNVKNAFKLSIEEIENKYSGHIDYLKSKAPKRGIIYDVRGTKTQAERNIRMAEIRYTIYDRLYNPDLNIKENAELLGVCEKTIRRYCKLRGIATSNKVTDEELRQLIDIEKRPSIRKIVSFLKEAYDIKVSKDRVTRIINELKNVNKLIHEGSGIYILRLNMDGSLSKDYYPIPQNFGITDWNYIHNLEYCKLEDVSKYRG